MIKYLEYSDYYNIDDTFIIELSHDDLENLDRANILVINIKDEDILNLNYVVLEEYTYKILSIKRYTKAIWVIKFEYDSINLIYFKSISSLVIINL